MSGGLDILAQGNALVRGYPKRVGVPRIRNSRRNTYSYTYSYTRISQIRERKRGEEIGVYEYVYEYGEESPINLTILSENTFSDRL